MRIVFLNGPFRKLAYSRSSRSPAVTKSGTLYYPIWLAYAAGLARRRTRHGVELIDAVARRWDRGQLIDYLQVAPPDLVFCDTSTPSIAEDLATAGAIKQALGRSRVVLVGTHATALPAEVLQADGRIDAVARGEYDQTALDLAQAVECGADWGEVAQISFRRGAEVVHTPDRPLLENLDDLPWVSEVYRDFLRLEDYFFAAAQWPMAMMITSRGCPHRCAWCLYPQVMHRGRYRTRSAANVAAEFAWIAEHLPQVREVGIEDDLFTGDRGRLREVCRLLTEQGNRLPFWCDTRVDLDYETMRLMKAAGCRLLIAGFESAAQAVLDRIDKGTQAAQAQEFTAAARRAGLLVHGCFVLGNPGETRASLRATLEFAKRLDPDTAQFFPMIPYPGTRIYAWAKEQGFLRCRDYGDWLTPEGLHDSVVDLPGLPGEEVRRFCDHARREFYLRRGYLVRKLAQSLTNWSEAQRNLKAFRRLARFLARAT